jgi:hypothetical protein
MNQVLATWRLALLLRGSCDFSNIEEYQQWLRAMVEREHNSQVGEPLAEERRYLRPLPAAPIPAYTTLAARVRRWSTITVLGHIYSLPSRLIGERVTVRVYAKRLEVYYRDQLVERWLKAQSILAFTRGLGSLVFSVSRRTGIG